METKQYLKLLTKQSLLMKGFTSQRSIVHSKNKPFTFIDKEFNQLETQQTSKYIEFVDVYKAIKNGTLRNWFSEVDIDVKKLYLPETQISMFCLGYPSWLSKNPQGSTFFLFNGKINGSESICIAQVVNNKDLCHVYFDLLENTDNFIFESKNLYKIVVPII